MARNKGKDVKIGYIDYTLIFIVLLLLGFGLIMVYSTSSYSASMSSATGNNPAYYLRKQAGATVAGLIMMVVMMIIPYHFWIRWAYIGYGVAAVLIFLVLTPLGVEINGARRWLNLGVSLQPAEVAKLAMILFLAALVVRVRENIDTPRGFMFILFSPAPIALMIYLITDNLSSATIVMAIAFIMLFVSSPNYKYFIYIIGTGALFVGIIVLFASKVTAGGGFRLARVRAWLHPEDYATGKGYQTLQSLYAIGSGGIFGKGLGQSTQKLGFIPEAQNDMIFSIICEELGLFGGLCIMFLFILLLWRMLIIAINTKDMFGELLVVGVMSHISVQVILNVAVVTNVIPNTGISLPFISYGGSSVMFLLMEVGLVFCVGRSIKFETID